MPQMDPQVRPCQDSSRGYSATSSRRHGHRAAAQSPGMSSRWPLPTKPVTLHQPPSLSKPSAPDLRSGARVCCLRKSDSAVDVIGVCVAGTPHVRFSPLIKQTSHPLPQAWFSVPMCMTYTRRRVPAWYPLGSWGGHQAGIMWALLGDPAHIDSPLQDRTPPQTSQQKYNGGNTSSPLGSSASAPRPPKSLQNRTLALINPSLATLNACSDLWGRRIRHMILNRP